MALIAKINGPLNISTDGVAQINARPYKQSTVQAGDEIFVWTSEQSGGYELAAHGFVQTARIESFANKNGQGEHKELVLDLKIAASAPLRALTVDQIAPRRDSESAARGDALYKHALNKITSIESETADFVRSHFKEQ
ncbi:hypothetical protein [Sulfitobacter sp.]|uniref:hypothetical protein n=1 Tax=Sulfitobacter sp. TaxID=1903071 RepID=UPI00300349B9